MLGWKYQIQIQCQSQTLEVSCVNLFKQICTSVSSLSLAGTHSPQASTQLRTDKATLLDSSSTLTHRMCDVNHSLCVPLSLCLPSPPFWTCLHCSRLAFYLSPISPHPIHHPSSIGPREEEDVPSCCAQVWLSEVAVCMCVFARLHSDMKERGEHLKTPLQSRCPSICADHSWLFPFYSLRRTHTAAGHTHTRTYTHLLQGSMTLETENENW